MPQMREYADGRIAGTRHMRDAASVPRDAASKEQEGGYFLMAPCDGGRCSLQIKEDVEVEPLAHGMRVTHSS